MMDPFFETNPAYNEVDRYQDFRQLFSSDQGTRVLLEIIRLSGIRKAAAPRSQYQTNETFFRDGARALGLHIIDIYNIEPNAKPATTRKK